VLLLLFIRLGFWQLDRAAQKQVLLDDFARAEQTEPQPIKTIQEIEGLSHGRDPAFLHISLRGTYLTQRQMLLENQVYAGRPGYHVLTPLRLADGVVVVDRGWIPAVPVDSLPSLEISRPTVEVAGLLRPFFQPGLRMGSPWVDDAWPKHANYPTAADISRLLGMPVASRMLLLDRQQAQGYVREWHPQIIGPGRHYAYAVQWFGFALVLVILYVFLNLKRQSHDE
jgi:cytochrome oxidase assembly protein ShyY1